MKISNYLVAFGGILVFLTFGHFVVIYKYFQVLIHNSLYYCQEMIKALNIQLPGEYGKVIAGILLLVALFTLLKMLGSIVSIFSFRKSLLKKRNKHTDKLTNLFKTLELHEKVIVFTQKKPQAFCFGIRNPKIFISTGLVQLMNRNELTVILRHEKYHLEHRDTLILFLAAIIKSLFPFFPVLSDFIRIYRTEREVEADKAAIDLTTGKQSLREVLRKLIKYEPTIHPNFLPGIIGTDTLEARIRSLNEVGISYKKIGLRNLVFSLISLAALLGLMITPVNAIELHAEGRDVVMLCSESVSCESVCRKQTLLQLQSYQPQYSEVTSINFSSAD